MSSMATDRRQAGFALPMVIAIVAVLSVLVLGFGVMMRNRMAVAHNSFEQAKARELAEAGVTLAVAGLTMPDPQQRWRADGSVRSIAFDGGSIAVAVQDESGKIDLNWCPPEILTGLLAEFGADSGSAKSIVDAVVARRRQFMSGRPSPTMLPVGEVMGAALLGGPRQRDLAGMPFATLDQLRAAPGMSRRIFAIVEPYLTVYAQSGHINLMTAPLAVLLAVPGMTPSDAKRLIAGRGATPASPPDIPAASLAYLSALDLRSATITAVGVTAGGSRFARRVVAAMTGEAGHPMRFLEWRVTPEELEPLQPLADGPGG